MSGAFIGLGVALGLLLIVSRFRATTPASITQRIAPRVGGFTGDARAHSTAISIQSLLGPQGLNVTRCLSLAESSKILEKVRKSGKSMGNDATDLNRFRIEQITFLGAGLVAGAFFGLWNVARGAAPFVFVLTIALGGILGFLIHDRHIATSAKRRTQRIDQQFPDVAELLAFAVTAGETPLAALTRVANMSQGALAQELHTCVRSIRSGESLATALRSMASRTGSRNVERFTDGLVIAMERGTPLSEVLRAQAADARAEQRQRLIELAGKKDVAMLVPVVFFVLPTVIVIALFPAMRGLQVLVP
jgi:tight adherence protein C